MANQFRGIAFPFRKGKTSFPEAAADDDLIRQSIFQILGTSRGERVMRPTFGANVYKFVFANNNDLLADLIATEVRTALGRFEPRISVVTVQVVSNDNEVVTTVSYVVKATNVRRSVDIVEQKPR